MCPDFNKNQILDPNRSLCMNVGPYFDKNTGKTKPIEDRFTDIYPFPNDCIGFDLHIKEERGGERKCSLSMFFICHGSMSIPPETYEYIVDIPFDTAKALWLA